MPPQLFNLHSSLSTKQNQTEPPLRRKTLSSFNFRHKHSVTTTFQQLSLSLSPILLRSCYGNITVITSQTIVQLSQCRVISRPSRILLQTRQRFASIIYTLCFAARTTRNFIRITIELVAWAALSFIHAYIYIYVCVCKW